MRPSTSLNHVSALLDHRRRQYYRVRRLWGTGLGLLGSGLLLLGGWVTLPVSLRPSFPAGMAPAPPIEGPGSLAAPYGASPLLLAGMPQLPACQALPPWQTVCVPSEGFDPAFPMLLWHAAVPVGTPWALPRPGQASVAPSKSGGHSGTTPSALPARGNRPPPRLSASACSTLPCPAAPAVRRPPPPVPAHGPTSRKLPNLRSTRPRQPAEPIPPQPHVSAYGSPVLAESERFVVSPATPERLMVNPEVR
jgi:hypothetical protein